MVWGAPVALANTTVLGDQNLSPNMGNLDQIGQNIPVFQGDAGSGYVLSAPTAGKITSWSFLSGGAATGEHFELAVLAPTDQTGQGWRLLATSAPVAVSTATGTDAVNGPFAVSISIDVGERIALMPTDGSSTPIETGVQGMDGIRYFSQPFIGGLGSSQQVAPGSTADNGQIVPIQATLTFSGPPAPPANTSPPSISGTATQFETLTGDPGRWQNGVTRFTYTWLHCSTSGSDCVAVPESDSSTYVLTRDDVGFRMRLRVIASNQGGDSQPAVSAPTAVVQRGVISAKLTVAPNPSCTGITTRFDASDSVSPDGIKSYSFRIVDLYAAAKQLLDNLGYHHDEGDILIAEGMVEDDVVMPPGTVDQSLGGDSQWIIDHFGGPATVYTSPTAFETFDWDRSVSSDNPPGPADLMVRDPVAVVLLVTDYAGHTSQTVQILRFRQFLSNLGRDACPKTTRHFILPNVRLLTSLAFSNGSTEPATTVRCQSRVTCVGNISVVLRGSSSLAGDAAHRRSRQLASGFFNVPRHRKHRVVLTLTKLGKKRLHRGAHVPVRITVVSVSPTGSTRKHVYKAVLKR